MTAAEKKLLAYVFYLAIRDRQGTMPVADEDTYERLPRQRAIDSADRRRINREIKRMEKLRAKLLGNRPATEGSHEPEGSTIE